MDSTAGRDRDAAPPAPFLLKLFYRTGAFHRPDEFASGSPHNLPPHVNIYTWPSCTLSELSHQLADSMPDLLPSPSIGTRLAFRLIYADARGGPGGGGGPQHHRGPPARFIVKDLGSVVIGDGGPGIHVGGSAEDNEGGDDVGYTGASAVVGSEAESAKTLGDAKFVVGDYISCAILPPSASGAVAPASSARTGRGAGLGESRTAMGGPPPRRENGFGGGGRGGRGGGGSRGGYGGGAGGFGARDPAGSMPMGDWRRGERLPDTPPGRDRDRGRGRGRW